MFKFTLASVALALAASVAAKERGITTASGQGFPAGFPPNFRDDKWGFATFSSTDCSGYAQPVCSLNDGEYFGYNGCGNLTFTKEDGIKATKIFVNANEPEMSFRMCNYPHVDDAASHCHKIVVEPNTWKCVAMVTNEDGQPEDGKDFHNLHKLASIDECDKK
ncbi:hypothetical protein MCAP1_003612 [Malassezia caprae]|uniref:Uncharacterized protein n=1 Tax=Malassezia caprae TaxID=1381934 RepID=A0AAF0EB98_9BASI|nr:hypothetical protein MCAP1_001967 [Malassezia caprae]WFD21350.1 hypothetical protein MCAP1_003612 [Malassezia caprae]